MFVYISSQESDIVESNLELAKTCVCNSARAWLKMLTLSLVTFA